MTRSRPPNFALAQGETQKWTPKSCRARASYRPSEQRQPPQHPVGRSRAALLETIADMGGEATLTELSNRTRLNISTCHHLLATLIKRNFVAKVPGKRLYALGGRILYIGHACLQVDLPRRAQPLSREHQSHDRRDRASRRACRATSFAILSVREARHAVRVETGKLGKMPAPHAQSIGKAMLAWLPEDEIRRILGKDTEALHRQHHHRLRRTDRGAARRAPQRLCARQRRISAGRHLRRRRDPRSCRRGGRRASAPRCRSMRASRGASRSGARRSDRCDPRAVGRVRPSGRAGRSERRRRRRRG